MFTHVSTDQMTMSAEGPPRGGTGAEAPGAMTRLAVRVHGEYREMPGLRLTVRQAARLFGVAADAADAVLDELRRASILTRADDGAFSLIGETSGNRTAVLAASDATARTDFMRTEIDAGAVVKESLRDASLDRLAPRGGVSARRC